MKVEPKKFWVNNHAHVLRGKGISNELLLCFMEQCDVAPFVTGAVQAKLSQGNLKSIPYVDPGRFLAQAFDDVTRPWFERIRTTIDENKTLATLRDTLLPKLLSGQLRIRDAAALASEAA